MESHRTPEVLNSDVTVTSGLSEPGDPTSTATSPSLSSWPSAETSLLASLAGVSGSPSALNDAATAFFSNKGDVAGVFVGVGILVLIIVGIVYVRVIRRRQNYSKRRNSQDSNRSKASMTFSTLMHRLDTNPVHQASGPPQKLAIYVKREVTRFPSQRLSLHSLSEWWIRRRERRASQLNQSTLSPSVVDNNVKGLGEETQWTLGRDLEDQKRRVVTPPTPASLLSVPQPNSPRRATRGPSLKTSRWSRGGWSVAESEGGYFTLEDAFSTLRVVYEPGSSPSGRHPYARP